MQAWSLPAFNPPSNLRLEDNLQRKGLIPPPRSRPRDGVPSATVEVLGRLDTQEEQLRAFRDWIHGDLQLAFLAPPPRLQALELNAFMMSDPSDPAAAIKSLALGTRAWYQAPMQAEALERARVLSRYK